MKYVLLGLFAVFLAPFATPVAQAASAIDIEFPVVGEVSFIDSFYYPRSGGRTHYATDIMGAKMMPLVATVDGVIAYAPMSQPSYGYMLTLKGDDGYTYNYLHINNDTPGTDDGRGGAAHAYAEGIAKGVRVVRGQLLGWLGDSGNAEGTAPHLHFEIYSGRTPVNPYKYLLTAQSTMLMQTAKLAALSVSYDRQLEMVTASSISEDKQLEPADGETACTPESLMRTADVSTVYYCGVDGGRYVFQNENVFFSWYGTFDTVETVSADEMAAIPLRGIVTYKPGSQLVKLQSNPRVYAIGRGGVLHWVPSVDIAQAIYGSDWTTYVRDLSDAFFPAYDLGIEVTEL